MIASGINGLSSIGPLSIHAFHVDKMISLTIAMFASLSNTELNSWMIEFFRNENQLKACLPGARSGLLAAPIRDPPV